MSKWGKTEWLEVGRQLSALPKGGSQGIQWTSLSVLSACLTCPALPALPVCCVWLCLSYLLTALSACILPQAETELTCSSKILTSPNQRSAPTSIKLFQWQLVTSSNNNPHKSCDLMFTENLTGFMRFQNSTAIRMSVQSFFEMLIPSSKTAFTATS